MKSIEELAKSFKLPTEKKVPFKCQDGYLVEDKSALFYHLVLDKIQNKLKGSGKDFQEEAILIYEQLEKQY